MWAFIQQYAYINNFAFRPGELTVLDAYKVNSACTFIQQYAHNNVTFRPGIYSFKCM